MPFDRAVLVVCAALASCGPHAERSSPDRAVSSARAPDVSAPPPSASAPAPLDRAAALRLGRKLAQASKWSEAAAALARAASVEPSDAVLLSELGWAQLKAGDLDPSRATSERALPLAADPRVRAQILYNLGRVAEAKHEDATAKERYEQSLALRPNRTVQARLEALGGALSAAPAGAPTPRLPCDRVFANRQALCDCLLADREVLASRDDAPRSCGAEPNTPGDREGELSVLRFGVDERALGEAAHLLAANVGGGLRPVADLGRDYRGTDGAESKVAVRGFEARSLEGRRLLLVRSDLEARARGRPTKPSRSASPSACCATAPARRLALGRCRSRSSTACRSPRAPPPRRVAIGTRPASISPWPTLR